jgi:hypothetical protein
MTTAQPTKPVQSALLPFCGRLHQIIDGLPIAHRCRVIPPDAIPAAIRGDFDRAIAIMARAAAQGPLPEHSGVWKLRRRR